MKKTLNLKLPGVMELDKEELCETNGGWFAEALVGSNPAIIKKTGHINKLKTYARL